MDDDVDVVVEADGGGNPQAERIAQLAAEKLNMKLGVKKELKRLIDQLHEGEEVVNLARGEYDGKRGLVVVSDRRILFYEQGMVRSKIEDFPYDKISSVQTGSGVMSGKLTIFAAGNKAEIEHVRPKERAKEIGDYVRTRGQIAPAQADVTAPAAAAPSAALPAVERLKQLVELRDQGLLTEEEFAAKKAQLLDQL